VFGVGPATRIYLAAGATDMRKGFDGLYGLVRDRLLCDPLSGHMVPVFECATKQAEVAVLGWERAVGLRKTIGTRAFPVARG
jgi:transposase